MAALHQMLEDGIRFDPHYLPSMNTDHLPMSLCALTALGASDDFLKAYRDDYSKILRPAKEPQPMKQWRDGIGKLGMYSALLSYFRKRINEEGIAPVVAAVAPEFMPGLAADAFHPIIRLAYAIDFDSKAETAAALAYMVSTTIEAPLDTATSINLHDALTEQATVPGSMQGRFGDGLRRLIKEGRYRVGCASGFSECAALSLDVYLSTRNFFALHMVTATQAARVVSQIVDERLVLASLTAALLAAHQIVGAPAFDRQQPLPIPDRIDREHTFKYAYACVSEYMAHGDERYRGEVKGFRDNGLIPGWAGREV